MQRKHINALSRAVRLAKTFRPENKNAGLGSAEDFDKFIKTAEEGLRFVRREFARQKGSE